MTNPNQNESDSPQAETGATKNWTVKNDKGYFRHGGPYDRGSADFYYGRTNSPHYFKGATYRSEKVEYKDMSKEKRDSYHAGWKDAEADNNRKEWR